MTALTSGRRRITAAQSLGWTEIRAAVYETDEIGADSDEYGGYSDDYIDIGGEGEEDAD